MTISQTIAVKAVLFDLDGTLLDTADDLGAALNAVLLRYNKPTIASSLYRPVASDGANALLHLGFGDSITKYDFSKLRSEFLQYYQKNIATFTKLYEGIAELLSRLNKQSIPWGIITNKPENLSKNLIPFFSEFSHCSILLGGDSLPEKKPHPLPLLTACARLNVEPSACFYIGDAQRDIEAGNNAGMKTFIAKWGYIKPNDNLLNWQADFLLEHPMQLSHYLPELID